MSELNLLERFFSVTNNKDNNCKEIRIFGITIKLTKRRLFSLKYNNVPVNPNKLVLMNYMGRPYGCNPKYVVEEILRQNLPIEIVWLSNDVTPEAAANFPKNVKLVKYKSKECMKELASAKVWLSNYHFIKLFSQGLLKKPNQFYIQTWHGSLGIKKIEKNVDLLTQDTEWTNLAKYNSVNTDIWISNSSFESEVYKTAFWSVKTIKEYGHPRNDIFFYPQKAQEKIKEKLYSTLEIENNKKILLYIPTFREDYFLACYNLEYEQLKQSLSEKFGGDWVILVRIHPRVSKYSHQIVPNKDYIYDVTDYPDIQELLLSADVAISDYSSCIYDFMLSRKPAFIYATDIADYDTDRGFYYPLSSTPMMIAECNEELRNNIKNFDYESYKQKVDTFIAEKGCIEDGHASERVVELIKELMQK